MRAVTLDQWLGLGVFLAAIAGSSTTWYALALRCGFPEGLAAVPTIALDVGGIVFGRNWIFGETARLRRWGFITTVLAVGISVVGNGIEHAIAAGLLSVDLWLVIAVGAVPPAALFAVAHQLALRSAPERAGTQVPQRAEIPAGTATQVPAEQVTAERPSEPVYTPAAGVDPDSAAGVDNQLAELFAGLAADQRALAADHHRVFGDLPAAPPPPADDPDPESDDEPDDEPDAARHRSGGTVVDLAHRPTPGTLLAKVREEYRRRARTLTAAGRSLDEIVLVDVDRAAGARPGYAKRHARGWRAEIEAETGRREEG
jgi:hypothetical protein